MLFLVDPARLATIDPRFRRLLEELTAEDLDRMPAPQFAAFMARFKWLCVDSRAKQRMPLGKWNTCVWIAGRFFGKALATDTPLPTPTGWTTMGDVKVGDTLYDERGRPCRVTATFEVMHDRPCRRLEFGDGTSVIADIDHEWLTWDKPARKAFGRARTPVATPNVRTTAEIEATLAYGKEINHSVPCCGSIAGAGEMPMDPYALGYWLGNGSLGDPEITCHIDDVDHVAAQFTAGGYGQRITIRGGAKNKACVIRFGQLERPSRIAGGAYLRAEIGTFLGDLRHIGVARRKHIPGVYLRARVPDREALLAGLMDSDGHASQSGHVEFCSTNRILATQVMELIISLGHNAVMLESPAMLNGVDCGPRWRITWTPMHDRIFRMSRKKDRLRLPEKTGKQCFRRHHRHIVSVDPVDSVPVRCITVDSPSSLFLCSRAMIPTHNTRTIVEEAWWEAWRVPGLRIHALSPTLGDVRRTMFEGASGFLAMMPREIVRDVKGGGKGYTKGDKEIHLINGSMIAGFSMVEEADRLRGPQCHMMIVDEAAAADRPAGNLEAAYNVAAFGCRLRYPDGSPSHKLIATTPRSIPFLKRLVKRPGVVMINGNSYENRANVATEVFDEVAVHEGTVYGKQEIHGMFIDDEDDQSIFRRGWFKLFPAFTADGDLRPLPEFSFILESYDTAFSEENFDKKTQTTDFTARTVFGVFNIADQFPELERKRLGLRGRYGALICDYWHERLSFPDLLEKARTLHRQKWGKRPGRRADIVLIEEKGSGISLRQGLATWGVPTWKFNPGRQSKAQRAHAIAAVVKNCAIFLPESTRPDRKGLPRNWVEPLLEEVCGFKGEGTIEHDDGFDTFVQGLHYLADREMLKAEPQVKYLDLEEQREAEEKEAKRLRGEERRVEVGNPYGA